MNVSELFGCPQIGNKAVFLAGLECELEGVRNGGLHIGNFQCTKDGSLRGHGYEYVTAIPRDRKTLEAEFAFLHKNLTFYDKEDPFSVRTSTHVHINCSPLAPEEVRNIVLLYALFEDFFFAMVKPSRRDNIHCVPLTETYLPKIYGLPLPHFHENWHKYTALNLKRLHDLGTLEFRHMHGTGSTEEISTWLQVLENLWHLGQRVSIDAQSLQDKATITSWFEQIFAPSKAVMSLKPSLFSIIHNTLIDVKFSV